MPVGNLSGEKSFLVNMLRGGGTGNNGFLDWLLVNKLGGWIAGLGPVSPTGVLREQDFAYILESESKRSERSGHLFQILLVYRTNAQGAVMMMKPDIAKTVIAALSMNLRDTDSIGWYREGYILGGVLTVLRRGPVSDACARVRPRLVEFIQDHLGVEESRHFQLRGYQPHELKGVLP